jgi:predicted transcriptional regulator
LIRRSKLVVLMDIMKVVGDEGEVKRTQIMSLANVSWNVLEDALATMERIGVVASDQTSSPVVVRPTQQGLDLLETFRSVESIFTDSTPEVEGLKYPIVPMDISR